MTMTSGMQIIQRSGEGWSGGADPGAKAWHSATSRRIAVQQVA